MPATPLATADQLAAYLQGDVNAGNAGNADLVLAGVSGQIRGYCGWVIAPADTDAVLTEDGSGARVQPLPTLHLTNVAAVTEDGADVGVATLEWSHAGYLSRQHPFTRRPRGITATVTHGYPEVPAELLLVALSVASRAVANPTMLRSFTTGGISGTYASEGAAIGPWLNDLEKAVLNRYRLPGRS